MFLITKISALLLLGYIVMNIYFYFKRRQYRHITSFPVPFSLTWFMGNLSDVKMRIRRSPTKNYGQILSEYQEELGEDTVYIPIFNVNLILTSDLTLLPKLLTERKVFLKGENFRDHMGWCAGVRGFGNYGLLVDPGTEVWATKKRIMDPAFTRSFLRTTMDGLNKVVGRLVKTLETKSDSGQVFDVSDSLDRAAFESISLCGFDWSDDMIENHGEAAMRLARVMVKIAALVWKDPLSFKLPWAKKAEKQEFREAVLPMRDLNLEYLMKIKEEAVNKNNLLSSIIRANSCSDELTMKDLVDDYNVFLVAGMETTSITMACAVWYLSMNPHVCETAQAEVDEVFGDKEELEFEDVNKLVYIEMIIKESLRLKGPASGTDRQCKYQGASVNGMYFPKGTQFFVPFQNIHMDPRYWRDPEVFDPERFSPGSVKNIRPYTYMPFSTGPRNCIGKNFAILEMKTILANILRKFVIVNGKPEEKELLTMGNITIRPINGVNVRIFTR